VTASGRADADRGLEATIGRLLAIGTFGSVALLLVGTILMLAEGRSPLDLGPAFDPGWVASDVLALRSPGFLWLGILGILATPSARVVAALLGYARRRDSRMTAVAALILVVLVAGVVAGTAGS
jgi:uncharacterized membrane protein